MTSFNDNLYYPQLFNTELASFLSTKGLDVLFILLDNKKPMRTVALSLKLQEISGIGRSRSGGVGRLSHYLRKARDLHLIESRQIGDIKVGRRHVLNKLTPKGIGIVNNIRKFDNMLIGIESDGQINFINATKNQKCKESL